MNTQIEDSNKYVDVTDTNLYEQINVAMCQLDLLKNKLEMIRKLKNNEIVKETEELLDVHTKRIDKIFNLLANESQKKVLQ